MRRKYILLTVIFTYLFTNFSFGQGAGLSGQGAGLWDCKDAQYVKVHADPAGDGQGLLHGPGADGGCGEGGQACGRVFAWGGAL